MRKPPPKPLPAAGAEMRQAGIDAGLYDHDDSYYANVVRGKPRELALTIPGAPPESLERGLAVAHAVFQEARVEPDFAEYASLMELESYRCAAAGTLRQELIEAAAAFRLARAAAFDAALKAGAGSLEGAKLFVRVIL